MNLLFPPLRKKLALGFLIISALACSRSPAKPDEPPKPQKSESKADSSKPEAAPTKETLKVGSAAPLFATTAHSGEKISLEGLRGKVVVLYFYPKDGTPGCTVEAEAFRDEYAAFQAKNAVVLGVSSDGNASHAEFAQELGLPFLLLPDESGAIRRVYGVGSFLGFSSRVTFIIDRAGQIAEIYPQVEPRSHAHEILRRIGDL
jgi:thioredoxin-dependent peroxiredoxin